MELSPYIKMYPSAEEPGTVLIYATVRGAVLQVSQTMLEAILAGVLDGEEQETLVRLGILVADAAAERERMRGYFDWANQNSRRFLALVTLNLDCNLACPYCYEDHFRGRYYMNEATADLLAATILEGPLADGKDILLDFYGGEALLSLPLIRRISAPLRDATTRRGTAFSFTIVTNGTLLDRRIMEELLQLGLSGVRITIDGPPDIHNSQRPFISGRGSFGAIVGNLKESCDLIPFQLGGNFTRDNYRRFPELLDMLQAEGIAPDSLASVQFSPVIPKAGDAGMTDFAMGCVCNSEPWLLEATLFLREEILRRGWYTPKPRMAGCMVEFDSDVVVGFDGALYKCPAFMGWPDLRIGSLRDGIGDYARSHRLDIWKNEECLTCPYLPLCFGGCRFLSRLRTGAIDDLDCRRDYLDAALEKLLRQDLKWRKNSRPQERDH